MTTLHGFADAQVTNDGAGPQAGLIKGIDGNFYGVTASGGVAATVTPPAIVIPNGILGVTLNNLYPTGSSMTLTPLLPTGSGITAIYPNLGNGTLNNYPQSNTSASVSGGVLFMITPQGTETILHKFGDGTVANDGIIPTSRLVQAPNGIFYGTTFRGGAQQDGTVFQMTSQGGFTILHSFNDGSVNNDGALPVAGLTLGHDGNLYGTTFYGGSAHAGTIFKITPQGTVVTLHSFDDGSVIGDGTMPEFGLVEDAEGNFYGTTATGGANNRGAVYLLSAQGQYSILYSFSQPTTYAFNLGASFSTTSTQGYNPNSRLLIGSDGNLYGTTASSGYGRGTIYKLTPQGQMTFLHNFGDGSVANDGAEVDSGENELMQATSGNGSLIYGTTANGGAAGKGTLFKMTTAGALTILHSFGDETVTGEGNSPLDGVVQDSSGILYGTACVAGKNGSGSIFKVNLVLPGITSPMAVSGALGAAFSYQVVATQSPTSYSATGLPAGLTLNTATGLISGTPMAVGISNVTLSVANSAGSNSATLVLNVSAPPEITSLLDAFASTSTPFSYQIIASGSSVKFSAAGLPAGLSIDPATGIIYGTPTATGTFPVTISVSNVAGTNTQALTLVITATAPTHNQEYVLIHNFDDGSVSNEGIYPGSVIPGPLGTFLGVTAQGGVNSAGTIFQLSASGIASVLSDLGNAVGSAPQVSARDSSGNFYGTTQSGGSAGKGTVFKVSPTGVVTVLHTFGDGSVSNDGANPQAGVLLAADGNFYGTTQNGGTYSKGIVFKMDTQGGFTIFHSFDPDNIASDGAYPATALIQDSNGTIYGTTVGGGAPIQSIIGGLSKPISQTVYRGTVFSISQGRVTTLHSFADGTVANDGQQPLALIDVDGVLYGTTFSGGSAGKGTLFKMTAAGVETILHHFGDGSVANDGANPLGALASFTSTAGLTLFGATQNGGAAGQGAIFEINPALQLSILHSFGDGSVSNDGIIPVAGLILGADGNLYGTTVGGGAGSGAVFALATNLLPPAAPVAPTTYWTLSGNLPTGVSFDSTTGTISGAPSSSAAFGAYALSIAQVTSGVSAAAQSIIINLGQQFSAWAASHSLVATPSATPRNDGVPNLLKYLTGINPAISMSADERAMLPTLGMFTPQGSADSYLTLTFRQSGAAVNAGVTLQTSTDLQTWTDVAAPNLLKQQIGTDSATGAPLMEIGVKAVDTGKQFLRLKVAAP